MQNAWLTGDSGRASGDTRATSYVQIAWLTCEFGRAAEDTRATTILCANSLVNLRVW